MPRRPVSERFWEKVEKTDTCWLWRAGPHRDDLNVIGVFQLGRGEDEGLIRAPHYAWLEAGNEIPSGMFLCHKCDTPKCVRPDHIFLGTPADNSRDMARKGRAHESKKTHCPEGHPYDRITEWRGMKARRCSICLRKKRRERYLREGR